jgi:hypothetical protein
MDEQRKQEQVSGFVLANPELVKKQAIIIAAAIFAARDLANDWNGGRSPRAIAAAANAIDKAKFLVEEIDRRLQ